MGRTAVIEPSQNDTSASPILQSTLEKVEPMPPNIKDKFL
ncbi:prophage protein (plasmid) [Acetobacter orientalis]|uniref:Prophage protein n=1 Tax=Acetobacter orientalis TaxID=146474 RepID=A0A2Z5ZMZ0_9PROT|nr:prophage protein [Acetobacter orientalis]